MSGSKVVNIPETANAMVNQDGQLHVVLRGAVDTCNSTATPLAAGASFTGTACDMLDYGIVFVTVYNIVDCLYLAGAMKLISRRPSLHRDV